MWNSPKFWKNILYQNIQLYSALSLSLRAQGREKFYKNSVMYYKTHYYRNSTQRTAKSNWMRSVNSSAMCWWWLHRRCNLLVTSESFPWLPSNRRFVAEVLWTNSLFCLFVFPDRVSLCSFWACSGIHSVDRAVLVTEICLILPSQCKN